MPAAWKVGALVLIFVGLILGIFATLGASIFTEPKELYYAKFADAGGLDSGADVLLAGVSIGRVDKVELTSTGEAIATLAIEQGRKLDKSLVAVLPTSFISLGDKQVLLRPMAQASGTYTAGDRSDPIPGILQGPLDEIFPDTEETMAELNKTMVAFRSLLEDKELKDGLVGIMKSGETTATKFGNLADNFNSTLTQNSDEINTLMKTMVATMKNVQSVSAEIEEFAASGTLQDQTEQLLTTMNAAATEGKGLMEDLRAYTADPELQDSLKSTLKNFESMSASGVNIAADTEVMTKNGIEISQQTKELMTKANKLADEVEKLIEDVKGAVKKFDPTGAGAGGLIPKVEVESDLTYNTEASRIRTDLNLKIPAGKEKLIFGLYDAFESNKLNILLERSINDRTDLRYGVYASKPGAGVSYRFAPNTWLQSEVFGLNDPQLDLRLKHRFNEALHGWVGIERVFDRNSPAIGIGIKR